MLYLYIKTIYILYNIYKVIKQNNKIIMLLVDSHYPAYSLWIVFEFISLTCLSLHLSYLFFNFLHYLFFPKLSSASLL